MAESSSAASYSASTTTRTTSARSRPGRHSFFSAALGEHRARSDRVVVPLGVAPAGDVVAVDARRRPRRGSARRGRNPANSGTTARPCMAIAQVAADHRRQPVGLAVQRERGALDLLVVLEFDLEQPDDLDGQPGVPAMPTSVSTRRRRTPSRCRAGRSGCPSVARRSPASTTPSAYTAATIVVPCGTAAAITGRSGSTAAEPGGRSQVRGGAAVADEFVERRAVPRLSRPGRANPGGRSGRRRIRSLATLLHEAAHEFLGVVSSTASMSSRIASTSSESFSCRSLTSEPDSAASSTSSSCCRCGLLWPLSWVGMAPPLVVLITLAREKRCRRSVVGRRGYGVAHADPCRRQPGHPGRRRRPRRHGVLHRAGLRARAVLAGGGW